MNTPVIFLKEKIAYFLTGGSVYLSCARVGNLGDSLQIELKLEVFLSGKLYNTIRKKGSIFFFLYFSKNKANISQARKIR